MVTLLVQLKTKMLVEKINNTGSNDCGCNTNDNFTERHFVPIVYVIGFIGEWLCNSIHGKGFPFL